MKHKLCIYPQKDLESLPFATILIHSPEGRSRGRAAGLRATGTSMIRLARKVRKGKAKVAKVAKAKVEDPMAKVTMEATDTMKATVAWA